MEHGDNIPLTNIAIEAIYSDRALYSSNASAQITLLDKSIISISGASFSIAMGFINNIIPLLTAKILWLLWLSMFILAFSIVITVISFHYGYKSAHFNLKLCDDAIRNNDASIREQNNPWLKRVNITNTLRLWTFIFGISSLAVFICYNGIARLI
jgi:hypothetical protein